MRKFVLIFTLTLAGALSGIAIPSIQPHVFTSKTTILIVPEKPTVNMYVANAVMVTLSRHFLQSTIVSKDLYPGERDQLPLADFVEKMRKDSKIDRVTLDGVLKELKVSFHSRDAGAAERGALAIMERLASIRDFDGGPAPASLETLHRPSLVPRSWGEQFLCLLKTCDVTYAGALRVRTTGAVGPLPFDAYQLRRIVLNPELLSKFIFIQNLYPEYQERPRSAIEKLRRRLRVEIGSSLDELRIAYAAESPDVAQRQLSMLISCIFDSVKQEFGIKRMEQVRGDQAFKQFFSQAEPDLSFVSAHPPSLPKYDAARRRTLGGILGAIGGLAIGCIWATGRATTA